MTAQLPLFATRDPNDSWTVRTSRRARRLSVRVYPGGRVEIVAPPSASPSVVQRFIGQHRQWIDDRVRDFATMCSVDTQLPDVIEFTAFGIRYAVDYVDQPGTPRVRSHSFSEAGGRLIIGGSIQNRQAVAKALRHWLMDFAADHLGKHLRGLADEFGFDFAKCQIRRQRTRWGSCSMSGTISLNVCLLFLDPSVARYLMIHELCHTKQMNHSPRFWRLVETCEPNYRVLDRALTRSWQQVPWWMFG